MIEGILILGGAMLIGWGSYRLGWSAGFNAAATDYWLRETTNDFLHRWRKKLVPCVKCGRTFSMPAKWSNPILCEDCDPHMSTASDRPFPNEEPKAR